MLGQAVINGGALYGIASFYILNPIQLSQNIKMSLWLCLLLQEKKKV